MPRRILLHVTATMFLASTAHALATFTATTITASTSWGPTGATADDTVLVSPASGNTLTISGAATLTIQPGTVVLFAAGKSLVVGAATAGSLSAAGTLAQPIEFTASSGAAGGWAGLDFADNSDLGGATSVLANCLVHLGGSTGFQVRLTNTNGVTLTNCTIADYKGPSTVGLELANSIPAVSGGTIGSGQAIYPVSGGLPGVAPVVSAVTLPARGDGKYNGIRLEGTTVAASMTLPRPPAGFCYITNGSAIEVNGVASPVLTIANGTLLKMTAGQYLRTGNGSAGALKAKGVVFTSSRDDTLGDTNGDGTATVGGPNQWRNLRFESATLDAQTALDSCIIRFGGDTDGWGILVRDAQPTLTRCVIDGMQGNGLRVENSSTAAEITGNLFRNSTTYEISATVPAMGNLLPGNTVLASVDGRYDAYELVGGTVATSMTLAKPPAGFCYITDGGAIEVKGVGSPVLTIANGSLIKMVAGQFLRTGSGSPGALKASGVVFTSSRDDTLGDTNGDGNATVGGPNQWRNLRFESATIDAQTVLDGCIIRFGGDTDGWGILVRDAQPTLTHCVIDAMQGNGLRVENTSTAAEITGNLFRNSTTFEISATVPAMVNLLPNNTVLPSANGKYDAYELVGGTVASSMTLARPPAGFCYVTDGGPIEVSGAGPPVLTIASGTIVKMVAGQYLRTGNGNAGALRAKGVVFTSSRDDTLGDTNGDGSATTGGPNQWRNLRFENGTFDAQTALDSCIIRYGGDTDGWGVLVRDAQPTITRCVIDDMQGNGLRVENSSTAAEITGNLFRNSTTYEISATVPAMVNLLPSNSVRLSVDGRYDAYELVGGTVATSMTLAKPPAGFCYITDGGAIEVSGAGSPVLTIADGTVLKLVAGQYLRTGNGGAGALEAKGVVFTSSRDDTLGDTNGDGTATVGGPNQWRNLRFEGATFDAQTVLDSCIIRYGGDTDGYGILVRDAQPTITRCLIDAVQGNGLRVDNSSTAVEITGNLLRNSTTWEVTAPLTPMAGLIRHNTIVASHDLKYNCYGVLASTVTANTAMPKPVFPLVYRILGDVTINSGVAVSFELGTVVKFDIGVGMVVQGTLQTDGLVTAKPYAPTVFTSSRDDAFGDTNGDGTTSTPADGNWDRIEFRGSGNASLLRGVEFLYGGGGGLGQAYVNATGTQVSPNVTFRECHFSSALARGGVYSLNSNPRVDSCGFYGPTTMGAVVNGSTSVTINAENCWWNHASGPFDPSVVDPCTNPGGLGVGVSDFVDYCGWLTSEAPVTDVIPPGGADAPSMTRLLAIAPNPARGRVRFTLDVARGGQGRLEIFDLAGRRVRVLQASGTGFGRPADWDLRNDAGRRVAPGVYSARAVDGRRGEVRRVVVIE